MLGEDFPNVLAAARRGDDEAFAALWRDAQPSLLRYLRVGNGSVADDVAADTWLCVIQGLGRFRGDEQGFRAWLFTIARRRQADRHRAAARRRVIPASDRGLEDLAGSSDPVEAVAAALGTEAALRLIAALPPDQAEVVALRVIADLDVRQVARLLGKRRGTVRVLSHRGLRRLAELLRDQREL